MERYIGSVVQHYMDHDSFEESVVGQNLLRIIVIGGLYTCIEIIGLILSKLGYFHSDIRSFVFVVVMFHLLFLPMVVVLYRKRVFKNVKMYENLCNLYYGVILTWSVVFTILVYIDKEDMTIYSLVLFFISAVFLIEPNRSSVLYLSSYILFTAAIYNHIEIVQIANGLAFKGLIIVILALVVSQGNFMVRKRLFNSRRELEKLNETLREQTLRDSLTKLYNNAFVFDYLERETESILSRGGSLSLLMMDLDNFKNINDTYGHLFGDKVITAVSDKLIDVTRESDIVGRYGGEEFIVVLTDTRKALAIEIAERIRKEVNEIVFENDATITLSIGVAELSEQTAYNLVDAADGNLYKAKRQGKNRAVA